MSTYRNPDHQAELRRRQEDTLKLLRRSSCDPVAYPGLEYCSAEHCRRRGCAEVCAFGARRRATERNPKIHQLLTKHGDPLHEVQICRPQWDCDFGMLSEARIAAGKHLMHRVLNSFFDNTIIAVGTFKANPVGDKWACEIHLVVSGRVAQELQKAFSWARVGAFARVGPIKSDDLHQVLAEVMSCHLPDSLPQFCGNSAPLEQRKEFVCWLANMKVDEPVLRYGCDKDFNIRLKRPRTMKPKIKKRRRYPYHLIPYMFEHGAKWGDVNPNQCGYERKVKRDPGPKVDPNPDPDYYDK
jgi:hypothetical protein